MDFSLSFNNVLLFLSRISIATGFDFCFTVQKLSEDRSSSGVPLQIKQNCKIVL